MADDSHHRDVGVGTNKPTLKTIAELSGLAVPTVSRALNDAPDIGAKTKQKVRKIADEIGYVPNRAGVRLRTGRTNVVSLLLAPQSDRLIHMPQLISALAGGFRNTPYHMIVTPYFPDEDQLKPIRYIVETGSADAIVLNQIEPRDPRVAYLMEHNFPFVTHGRTIWQNDHPWFDFDNGAFAALGVSKLVEAGRKHILLIQPPEGQNYGIEMFNGASQEAERLGVSFQKLDGANSDDSNELIIEALSRLLRSNPRIDGVVCGSTGSGMAAVAAFEAEGRVIGRDFDLVSKEAMPMLKLFRPEIIAIYEDVSRAGEFLSRAAIQAIRDPSEPSMQYLDVPGPSAVAS